MEILVCVHGIHTRTHTNTYANTQEHTYLPIYTKHMITNKTLCIALVFQPILFTTCSPPPPPHPPPPTLLLTISLSLSAPSSRAPSFSLFLLTTENDVLFSMTYVTNLCVSQLVSSSPLSPRKATGPKIWAWHKNSLFNLFSSLLLYR